MRNFRERYGRYALFALIFGLGAAIFVELTPFLGGLMGAATIYVLLRGQMVFLTERRRWRRGTAAPCCLPRPCSVSWFPYRSWGGCSWPAYSTLRPTLSSWSMP